VRAAFCFPLGDAPNVRWDPDLEGGALMDVGCYCVSALRLLCGEPERLSCETVDRERGHDDREPERRTVDARASALLRFPGGVLGTFDCALDTAPRASLEVVGATGRLLVEDPWKRPVITQVHADGSREELAMDLADPYAREVEDLSRAVRTGTPPLLGRSDAVGQARTLEALYRAAAAG
jgi:predicted dehydrogenase